MIKPACAATSPAVLHYWQSGSSPYCAKRDAASPASIQRRIPSPKVEISLVITGTTVAAEQNHKSAGQLLRLASRASPPQRTWTARNHSHLFHRPPIIHACRVCRRSYNWLVARMKKTCRDKRATIIQPPRPACQLTAGVIAIVLMKPMGNGGKSGADVVLGKGHPRARKCR